MTIVCEAEYVERNEARDTVVLGLIDVGEARAIDGWSLRCRDDEVFEQISPRRSDTFVSSMRSEHLARSESHRPRMTA
jgi:hypothetical protein